MAIDLQLTPTAIQSALLSGAIKLGNMGQKKASATDILAQSGLEDISNVVAGKHIAGMGLTYTNSGNRKLYNIDPVALVELQETLIPDAPSAVLAMPDLHPEIVKVNNAIKWLQGQVNELRTKENRKQLLSQELRNLNALNLDSFENVEERKNLSNEIRRLRGMQHYITEANETLAALPDHDELEAEARTVGLALQAAQTRLEDVRKRIEATKAEERRCNQKALDLATAAAPPRITEPYKAPWWHRFLP